MAELGRGWGGGRSWSANAMYSCTLIAKTRHYARPEFRKMEASRKGALAHATAHHMSVPRTYDCACVWPLESAMECPTNC